MASRPIRPVEPSYGFTGDRALLQAASPREHAHCDIELNLLATGRMRYFFAGKLIDLPPGRWVAFWAAMPHQVIAVDGPGELLWVTVPVSMFMAWELGEGFGQRLLHGEFLAEPRARAGIVEQGREWIDDLKHGASEARRIVALESEALVRRMALDIVTGTQGTSALVPDEKPLAPARAHRAMAKIEELSAWLAAHYRDEVDVADCAAAVGLHPNYAMNLFRRTCGMTLWQYLTRLRLSHAQRLLLTSDRGVLDIAMDAGFGSQARFYVVFKQAYGLTPAAFRRRGGEMPPPAAPPS